MAPVTPRCGIVVPVCDEALILPRTVPALLDAGRAAGARIVWVCNGCTDDSAAVLRRLAAGHGAVIELGARGKTRALDAGDAHLGDLFPRFYIDADIRIAGEDLLALLGVLDRGAADLVSPRYRYETSGATAVSARIARFRSSLPHAGETAFHGVLGISAAGRRRWGAWPEVRADYAFAAASIPADRRAIVPDAVATSWAPRDFAGWARMRARWLAGERELRALGLAPPRSRRQRRALAARLLAGPDRLDAWLFLAARLAAELAALLPARRTGPGWTPDRRLQASCRRQPAKLAATTTPSSTSAASDTPVSQ